MNLGITAQNIEILIAGWFCPSGFSLSKRKVTNRRANLTHSIADHMTRSEKDEKISDFSLVATHACYSWVC